MHFRFVCMRIFIYTHTHTHSISEALNLYFNTPAVLKKLFRLMERNGTQISRTSAEWGKEKENLTLIFAFKVHRQEAIQQDFSNQDNCLQFFYLWICTSGMSHQTLALKWKNYHCKLLTHRLETSMIAFPLDSASAAVQGSIRLRDSQQGACIPTSAPQLRAAPSCSSTPRVSSPTISPYHPAGIDE